MSDMSVRVKDALEAHPEWRLTLPDDTNDRVFEVLAAHSEAIGALTDAVNAHSAAIRALSASLIEDKPKRRWWQL